MPSNRVADGVRDALRYATAPTLVAPGVTCTHRPGALRGRAVGRSIRAISTGADDTLRYGIVEVAGTLVAAEDQPRVGWPYVTGRLFGGDLTMTIAYRVTVMSST